MTSQQPATRLELYTNQFKQGNVQCNQATQLKIEQCDQLATNCIAITDILVYKFHYQILLYQLNWCIL